MRKEAEDRTLFVVGLGNPGRRYAATRHNVGFRVVEALARRWQAGPPREAFGGRLHDARAVRAGRERRVMLLAPQTYMNCSGRAARELLTFYKAAREDLLVVLDDLALPPGAMRMRGEGSSGGHKGLDDVLEALGGQDVPRLRLGIGGPPPGMDPADYVLQDFRPEEEDVIGRTINLAADAVEDWVFHGVEYVMNAYNRKGQEQS